MHKQVPVQLRHSISPKIPPPFDFLQRNLIFFVMRLSDVPDPEKSTLSFGLSYAFSVEGKSARL